MENLKTDRLKISGTSNSPEETQSIFKEIQEKTGVKIQWESNKVSAGTLKKDPVIRMCGTPDAVKTAREMILQNLEIQSNKLILKMDVTHEEHPSLIGKKGFLIKQVMDATGCRIHFPDKNLIPSNLKSNQVSITGDPSNVEKARIMIRALLPFQVIFEVERSKFPLLITSSPFWKSIDQKLGLAIHFIDKRNLISVVIRCSQGHFRDLRPHILSVIEILSGERGSNLPPAIVVMDIMPQHQSIVRGPKGANIQAIAKRTGAKIQFPNINSEVSDPRAINITGNLDCVYMAWQEIMSSLPICVLFDVSESRDTKSDYADFLTDCNISVFSKPNPKYYIKSITVKGPEKFSKQILQYRQRVLNLPSVRFLPDVDTINKALGFPNSLSNTLSTRLLENLPTISSIMLSSTQLESLTNVLNATNAFPCIENNFVNTSVSTLYPSVTCVNAAYGCKSSYEGIEGERTHSNMKPTASVAPMYHISSSPLAQCAGHTGFIFGKWDENVNNNNTEATRKDPVRDRPVSFEKRLGAFQAIHRNIESTQVPSSLWAGYGFSQSMPATIVPRDSDTSSLHSSSSLEAVADPESSSSSSSEETWDNIVLADYIDDKIWSNKEGNVFSMSNVFDFKRHTSLPMNPGSEDILPRLLYEEGLYSLLDIFLKEEIDYAAFLLLNDDDLISLGINYPARMKIICLIRELQDAEMKMKTFDAAPGAGRKIVDF